MIKFSVIIPNYNNAKYISKTINSVLNQTYNNWELIIVDDGSTDKSLEVIKKYTDNRIILVKNKNHGVSFSRNCALKKATGDYVIFIDSDDWIEPWVMQYLSEKIKKYDVDIFIGMFNTIKSQNINYDCKSENINEKHINNKQKKEVLEYLYKLRLIFTVWRFVYKRSILNIEFENGLIHEDEAWIPQILARAQSFRVIEKPFYNYRMHKNSIMTSKNTLYRQECLLKICNILFKLAKKEKNKDISLFYLRCCYKNLFQNYLGIRELSHPIKPIKNRFIS